MTSEDLLRKIEINKQIIQAMPGGVVHVKSDGSIISANAEALRILGLSFDEIVKKYTVDFETETVYEDGRPCPANDYPVSRALLTGEAQAARTLGVRKPNGETSWATFSAIPVKDPSEQHVIGAIVTFLDITEARHRSDALAKSERRMRAFIDNFPHYIVSYARDGKILYVNRPHENTTKEEVLSRTIFDFIPPEDHALTRERFSKVFDDKQTVCYEDVATINGTEFFFSNTLWPDIENDQVRAINVFATDISEMKRLNRLLEYRATHDSLTGLTNRYFFEEQTRSVIESIQAKRVTEAVLCYIDLDQFKIVNDTCGHAAGDELLKQISTVMRQHLDSSMVLTRLGGDEFSILIPGMNAKEGLVKIEQLREIISDFIFNYSEKIFRISASIGVTLVTSATKDYAEALKDADAACFAAKEGGRNQVHSFHANDEILSERRAEIGRIEIVNEAIADSKFELYHQRFQTNFPGNSGAKKSFEILLRFPTKDGEMRAPAQIIQAAERFDLMRKLDIKIIEKTFQWLKQNERVLKQIDFFTLNLSAKSIGNSVFQQALLKMLHESQLPMETIFFEITETAAMQNYHQSKSFMETVIKQGCSFVLDDFGTGISSLAYLRSLPVSIVKIDGFFIQNLATDEIDFNMVKSIHALAKSMGKRTIAECIETAEVQKKIEAIGIDFSQGYHQHRPEPLAQFA